MYKLDFNNLLSELQDLLGRRVTLDEIHKATGLHKSTLVYFKKGTLSPRKEAIEAIFNYAVGLVSDSNIIEMHKAPELVSMLFFVKESSNEKTNS